MKPAELAGFITKALGCKKPHRTGVVTRRAETKWRSGYSPSRGDTMDVAGV
jgi:hypothetical protein